MRAGETMMRDAEKAGKKVPVEFKQVKDEFLEQYVKDGGR